jgi:Dyp-type peroxidase family
MSTEAPAVPTEIDHRASEEVLEVAEIQGNSVAGFNKDFQTLLFLRIDEPALFKPWLGRFADVVATAEEVIAFNRLFKQVSARRHRGSVKASWINIAFSYAGLTKLTKDAGEFTDNAFRTGLVARAAELGDPTAEDAEGNPKHWLVRDGDGGADVVIVVAADTLDDLSFEVTQVERAVYAHDVRCGATVVFKEEGRTQPGALAGHEHFGFKDGISQPGIRGRASHDGNYFLTPSQNPADPRHGKPGQALIWPGEFVFGYRGESDEHVGDGVAPDWACNGSYLVFRRLRQDVFKFHAFLYRRAGVYGLTPDALGARFVGRWASGAPVIHSPHRDDPLLAADDRANNRFRFGRDPNGDICPFSSHIRKAFPRDDVPAAVNAHAHRLLRRGIPFGPSSRSTPSVPVEDDVDRGLLFMAYMTSITEQFEFVLKNWVNKTNFKEDGAELDAVMGQPSGANGARRRSFGLRADERNYRLTTTDDWVIPTGGGYFFAPSICALKNVLGERTL